MLFILAFSHLSESTKRNSSKLYLFVFTTSDFLTQLNSVRRAIALSNSPIRKSSIHKICGLLPTNQSRHKECGII
jgi:hypothetical protein